MSPALSCLSLRTEASAACSHRRRIPAPRTPHHDASLYPPAIVTRMDGRGREYHSRTSAVGGRCGSPACAWSGRNCNPRPPAEASPEKPAAAAGNEALPCYLVALKASKLDHRWLRLSIACPTEQWNQLAQPPAQCLPALRSRCHSALPKLPHH